MIKHDIILPEDKCKIAESREKFIENGVTYNKEINVNFQRDRSSSKQFRFNLDCDRGSKLLSFFT